MVGILSKSLKLPLKETLAGSFTRPPSERNMVSLLIVITWSSFVVEPSIVVLVFPEEQEALKKSAEAVRKNTSLLFELSLV